jgi:hypothetical protein
MGGSGVKAASAAEETAGPGREPGPPFHSAAELREILDRLLDEIDADPEIGPRLRSARVPHRFVFPDLDVVLNVTGSEQGGHCLRWSFSDEIDWKPALTLEMDSAVANRFLQGRENLAIAIARGTIHVDCGEARAALSFLPVSRSLIERYRGLVRRDFPHLALA